MIGDNDSDMNFAKNIGIKGIKYTTDGRKD
jgi:histidinol phosphatase-like enzyme